MIENFFFFPVGFCIKNNDRVSIDLCQVIFNFFRIYIPKPLYVRIFLLFSILPFLYQNSKLMTFQVRIIFSFRNLFSLYVDLIPCSESISASVWL